MYKERACATLSQKKTVDDRIPPYTSGLPWEGLILLTIYRFANITHKINEQPVRERVSSSIYNIVWHFTVYDIVYKRILN